jgi:hypothetical protein
MALVNARLSLSVYDQTGGGGTFLTHARVDDAQTLAQANSALLALQALYLTLGGAGIKELTFSLINKSAATSPQTTDRTGAGGVIDFAAGTPATTAGIFIPAFFPGQALPNGTINIGAGNPAAFVAALTGAVMGGTYTNFAYASLTAGLDGFLTNRKRIKRVRP